MQKKTAPLLFLIFLFSQLVKSQNFVETDTSLWSVDGQVSKLKRAGDTLIAAGHFNMVAPTTPYGSVFDNSGKLLKKFPYVNGAITKAIADEKNGIFITGNFSKVDDEYRGGLAYIDSNGKVSSFFKDMAINGKINDMQLKDSLLYVGGDFTGFNKFSGGFAKIQPDTALVDFTFPTVDGFVYAIEPDNEGGAYIGGSFSKVGEFYRKNIAHIDKYGRVSTWNPGTDGEVRAITTNSTTIYIGGYFDFAGCEKRSRVAAFTKGNNTPTSLSLDISTVIGPVYSLITNGGKLFIGTGYSFSGKGPSKIIAVNINNNSIAFETPTNGDIHAMAKIGPTMYAGGDIGYGTNKSNLVAFDTTYGTLGAVLSTPVNGTVYSLKPLGDSILFIGGDITNYGCVFGFRFSNQSIISFSVPYSSTVYSITYTNDTTLIIGGRFSGNNYEKNLAALSLKTKDFTNWLSSASNTVYSVVKGYGNTIFCGGEFKTTCGFKSYNLSSINVNTSIVSNWFNKIDYEVLALKVIDTTAYIGGRFSMVNNYARSYTASVSTLNSNVGTWYPQPNQVVNCLELSGDTLYMGGWFTRLDNNTVTYIGAVNRHSGSIIPWYPSINGNYISAFAKNNQTLFVCGSFNKINGVGKNTAAAFDIYTGGLKAFNPNVNPSVSIISAISLWKNNIVCAGYLSPYTETPKKYLTILDTATGNASGTQILTSNTVNTIVSLPNKSLFLGGTFILSGGKVQKGIVMLNLNSGKPFDWNPDLNGYVNDFDVVDGKMYFSGDFTSAKGKTRNYGAAAYLSNDSILNWNPNFGGQTLYLAHSNGKIFVSGYFKTVNGNNRNSIAAIDTGTAQPTTFNPFSSSSNYINSFSLHAHNNDIIIGGNFTSFNGTPRNYLASIDGSTENLNSFDARLSAGGGIIRVTNNFTEGNTLYLGGNFIKSDTQTTPGFLRLNGSSYSIDSWGPSATYPTPPIAQNNDDVYLSPSTSKINNKCRCYISAIDTNSKKLTSWYPPINASPVTIAFNTDRVYLGGYFTNFNHRDIQYLTGAKLSSVGIEDITNNSFCLGGDMKIKISTTGNFDFSNKFILILSDTAGTFSSPIYLDTIASHSDSFLYKIPTTLTPQNNYRLKVISTSPKLENNGDFYINILPEPKADFTINDPYQCLSGNVFIFKNSSNIAGNVIWSLGDSAKDSRQFFSHSYKTDSTYAVHMVLMPNGNGCPFDSIDKVIEILPQPKPAFTVNDSVQCNHIDSFVVNNQSTIRYGTMSYLWNFGNTITSTDSNSSVSFIDTGLYYITLTTTSDSGCVDSITHTAYVIDKIIPRFTVNDQYQCLSGNGFTFTNTTPGSRYFYTKWDLGEGDTASAMSITKSFPKDSSYEITLYSIKDSLCLDSTKIVVFVNPQPQTFFTVDSTLKCANDTFVFINSSSIPSGNINTNTWYLGDGEVLSATDINYTYDSVGVFKVTLNTVSDSGCVDTMIRYLQTKPLPIANFEINDTIQCFNTQNFIFTNLSASSAGDSIINYTWLFGDGTSSVIENPNHTYGDTGYYFVLLNVLNTMGCSDTAQLISIVAPNPEIDTITGNTWVEAGTASRYTITTDTFTTYLWTVNHGAISLGPDSSYADIVWDSVTVNTTATIKVIAINDAGCLSDTAYLTINIDTSSSTGLINVTAYQLQVYPNPANNIAYISLNNPLQQKGVLEISNTIGNTVYTQDIIPISKNDMGIDISMLSSGLYFITLKTNSYLAKAKMIVIH